MENKTEEKIMEKQPWLDTTNHSKPQKGIGINLYAMAEVLLVIAILLIVCIAIWKKQNKFPYILYVLSSTCVVDIILCLIQLNSSTCIHNQSGKTILCKNEDDDTIFPLKNGEIAYHIDGYKHNTHVFKIANGTHVKVKEDGTFSTLSWIGSIENYLDGGMLTSAPDDGWKNLFEHGVIKKDIVTKQPWLDTTNHSKPQKGIGINLYAIAELLFMVYVFALICLMVKNKTFNAPYIGYSLAGMLFIDAILIVIQLMSSTCIHNQSGKTILCKNEDNNTIFALKNGEIAYHIDGYKYKDCVYKIADGSHVKVNKDGSFLSLSILGGIENRFGGGLLETAPDDGWKNLFEHTLINENII